MDKNSWTHSICKRRDQQILPGINLKLETKKGKLYRDLQVTACGFPIMVSSPDGFSLDDARGQSFAKQIDTTMFLEDIKLPITIYTQLLMVNHLIKEP